MASAGTIETFTRSAYVIVFAHESRVQRERERERERESKRESEGKSELMNHEP